MCIDARKCLRFSLNQRDFVVVNRSLNSMHAKPLSHKDCFYAIFFATWRLGVRFIDVQAIVDQYRISEISAEYSSNPAILSPKSVSLVEKLALPKLHG